MQTLENVLNDDAEEVVRFARFLPARQIYATFQHLISLLGKEDCPTLKRMKIAFMLNALLERKNKFTDWV